MSTRHFLILHPSNEWYGADVMIYRAAAALRRHGAVTVAVPLDAAEGGQSPSLETRLADLGVSFERMPIPVVRRKYLSPHGLICMAWLCVRFVRAMRRRNHTVVVINTAALAVCVPVLRLACSSRLISYVHETLTPRESRTLGLLLGFAHRVVAISHSVKSSLGEKLSDRVVVIPNGVPDAGEPAPFPDGDLRFLFVGRWTPRKGVVELIKSWAEMDASDRSLSVVGGYPPNGQSAPLPSQLIESMPSISVVGEVAQVEPYIDSAHVVVVPSLRSEGLGLVAIEALSRGRPVVATDVAGLSEVVDCSVGWVLPSGQPSEWPEILKSIERREIEDRSIAARSRFEERFSLWAYETSICEAVLI